MNPVHVGRQAMTAAVLEAAFWSGPVFVTALIVVTMATQISPYSVEIETVLGLLMLLMLSIPFGFALALVPCWIAGHVLLTVARHGDGSLNPLPFLVVGTWIAGALGYLATDITGAAMMAMTGAVLANIVRVRALDRACEDG